MITTRTPLRISFFGGGTDYPVWYREHGGSVLATTIDKSCYVTCRWLPPFFEYHSRITYSQFENVSNNQEIVHPAVRGCLQFMGIDEGVEIHHIADLPARTGLGTSSAFTVGLLLGLHALKNQMRDKRSLASEAIFVEQEVIGEAVGAQDQVSAAYGGFNRIDFAPDGTIEAKPVLASASRLAELQDHLMLFFTGFSRIASEIAQEQIKQTPLRHKELKLMREMVDEAEGIVINPNRDLKDFGKLLHEGWNVKRSLTQKISNPHIDTIYQAGLSAGALGGKLLGAGGGGFMMFFVPPERQAEVRSSLTNLLCVPFGFSNKGSQVVVYEPEEMYDEALNKRRAQIYAHRD
jgi:D-glycero-alpha-D-manno-heptose-7-phosphate kinase